MISFIKRVFKKDESLSYMDAQPGAIVGGARVIARLPVPGKKYLVVKSGSIVEGQFVFERESGQITIGENTFVGGGMFVCIEGIEIGNDVLISWGCTFIDNDAHSLNWDSRKNDVRDWKKGLEEGVLGKYKKWDDVERKKICIGNKCWIGFNSIILKGVSIGEGSVIGAGSVITKDVPAYVLAAGNPARIIRELK